MSQFQIKKSDHMIVRDYITAMDHLQVFYSLIIIYIFTSLFTNYTNTYTYHVYSIKIYLMV
jgi:hypothetical protein